MIGKPCGMELKRCMPLSLSQSLTQTCWRTVIVKIKKWRFIFSTSLQVLLFPERQEWVFGLLKKFQHGLVHSACLMKLQNFMPGEEICQSGAERPWIRVVSLITNFFTPFCFCDWSQVPAPVFFSLHYTLVSGTLTALLLKGRLVHWILSHLPVPYRQMGRSSWLWQNMGLLLFFCLMILFSFTDAIRQPYSILSWSCFSERASDLFIACAACEPFGDPSLWKALCDTSQGFPSCDMCITSHFKVICAEQQLPLLNLLLATTDGHGVQEPLPGKELPKQSKNST